MKTFGSMGVGVSVSFGLKAQRSKLEEERLVCCEEEEGGREGSGGGGLTLLGSHNQAPAALGGLIEENISGVRGMDGMTRGRVGELTLTQTSLPRSATFLWSVIKKVRGAILLLLQNTACCPGQNLCNFRKCLISI